MIEYALWVFVVGGFYVLLASAGLRWISTLGAKPDEAVEEVAVLPADHPSYAAARHVLLNHSYQELEALDAAFEVLAHSPDAADRELCRIIEVEMWQTTAPSGYVIALTIVGAAVTCIGLASFFARKLL